MRAVRPGSNGRGSGRTGRSSASAGRQQDLRRGAIAGWLAPASALSARTTCRKRSPRSRGAGGHPRLDVAEPTRMAFHRADPVEQDPTIAERSTGSSRWTGSGSPCVCPSSDRRHAAAAAGLLQVNVSGEASKSGCEPDEVVPWRRRWRGFPAPAARPDGDSGADRGRSACSGSVRGRCANCSTGRASTGSPRPGTGSSIPCRWGCRRDLEAAIAAGRDHRPGRFGAVRRAAGSRS